MAALAHQPHGHDAKDPYPVVGGAYRKYVSLAVAIVWMVVCGSGYAYSSFSSDLQAIGYRDISLIGSCGNVGSYVLAITAGLVLDAVGSRWLAVQSVVLVTTGWVGFHYAILTAPGNDSAAALCFVVIGMGGIAGFLSCVNSVEEQFSPAHRGVVHGVLLAFYVLSSAIWASIYFGVFLGKLLLFAKTLSIVSAVLGCLNVAAQINHKAMRAAVKHAHAHASPTPSPGTNTSPTTASATGATTGTTTASTPSPAETSTAVVAVGAPGEHHHGHHDRHGRRASVEMVYPVHAKWGDPGFEARHSKALAAGSDDPFARILRMRSLLSEFAFLLYAVIFVTHGTARIFVNSAGLAIKAMRGTSDPDPVATAAFVRTIVVIFSVSNWIGRVAAGILNDKLMKAGICRLHMFTPSTILVLSASFILAFAPVTEGTITVGAILMGLGDGLGFTTWPVAVKDALTPGRYGRSFALFNSAVGFGSLGLNSLATATYHGHGHENANGSWSCYGSVCFKDTWVIAGSLVVTLGLATTIGLLHYVYRVGLIPDPPGHTPLPLPTATPTGGEAAGKPGPDALGVVVVTPPANETPGAAAMTSSTSGSSASAPASVVVAHGSVQVRSLDVDAASSDPAVRPAEPVAPPATAVTVAGADGDKMSRLDVDRLSRGTA